MADLLPSPRSWATLLAELEVATTCCLPLAAALPVLVLALSLRLNFLVQASFLLYVFLLGALVTGGTGLVCLYRDLSRGPASSLGLFFIRCIGPTQAFARTVLSTASTSILIVTFLTKVQASKETVNNAGIGFFILMVFAKFCSVTILPDVKFYSSQETGQALTFQMFEIVESFVDLVCLLSTGLWTLVTCNTAAAQVHPISTELVHEDLLPVTQPLNLPPPVVMTANRVFLVTSLHYGLRPTYGGWGARRLAENWFVLLHALVTPLLTLAANTDMRRQVARMLCPRPGPGADQAAVLELSVSARGRAPQLETEPADKPELARGHRPDSAPTRPSSASTAGALVTNLPGSVSEPSVRRPYRSNIRKHRSALETVVAAPRRRKNVKEKKKRGGPLDRVMLSMVGEKVIPLEESDEEDPSSCKTM